MFIKIWENYKIINFINLFLILYFKYNINNFLKKIYIINIVLNFFINSKLDFFLKHVLFLNIIKNIIINNIISLIIILFIRNNIKLLLLKLKIKKITKNNYIIISIIFINIINNINYFNIYLSINNILYKIKNILFFILNIIYWNNIIEKKKLLILIISSIIILIIWIYIFFQNKEIYNIYNLCGKLENSNIIFNQQISSLFFWIINSIIYLNNLIILKKIIKTNI